MNYSLLPSALTDSKEFNDALRLQRRANESALILTYTPQDPAILLNGNQK
jgi:hypothetical protein